MTCPVCVATIAANAAVVSTAVSGFVMIKRNQMIDAQRRKDIVKKQKIDLPVSIVHSQDQE